MNVKKNNAKYALMPIYRKEYFGFVYRWHDRGRDRIYIGSHYGSEDDGYVCSSQAMRDAHRRRPNDFFREIIWYLPIDDTRLLREKEVEWLQTIPDEELGKKYYNKIKHNFGLLPGDISRLSKEKWEDPEYRKKVADGVEAYWKDNKQAKQARAVQTKQRWANTEYQQQLSESHAKNWDDPTYQQKMKDANKKAWERPERKEASKEFNSRAAHARWSNPDYASKTKQRLVSLGKSHKGKRWYNNGTDDKMFHEPAPEGWILGRLRF